MRDNSIGSPLPGGSGSSGVNPMRRSSFKTDGSTPNNYSSSSSSSNSNSSAAPAVDGLSEDVKGEQLALMEESDGNEDSSLVLPSHSHLRLSDSKLHYSRVSRQSFATLSLT